ncbi:MAG: ornithine carbamoyltransferase [Planctomyces sp.]
MAVRHFRTLLDLSPAELQQVLARAAEMTRDRSATRLPPGRVMAMIFEKASTRTRVSFEAGMVQMGGHAMFLSPRDTQLGRGEPIEDSARVISSMVDIVMIRTFGHDIVERFASASSVPVINGLTDSFHPCQLLADVQTYLEHRGPIQGRKVAWIGDGNNMCHSYINAARQFDFELVVACPEGFEPRADLVAANKGRVSIVRDPSDAARDAHLLATDVWASMGQEADAERRRQAFAGYQVNAALMQAAPAGALFMHDLPAKRGLEVTDDVMDSSRSIVFDQAENRLHLAKGLFAWLLDHSR